jgi:mono/diheme cytochrome c family protein
MIIKSRQIATVFLIVFFAMACDKPSPEEVRKRQHLPGPDFVANVDKGNILFHNNCSQCHGLEGSGTDQGPPLVHKTYRPGHHSDLAFHWAVKDGVRQHHWKFGNMPPQPNISPEDAGHIVAYIRKMQRENGID